MMNSDYISRYALSRHKSSPVHYLFCFLSVVYMFSSGYLTGNTDILLLLLCLTLAFITLFIRGSIKFKASCMIWCPYFCIILLEMPYSHNLIATMKVFTVSFILWASAFLYANCRDYKKVLPKLLFLLSGLFTFSVIAQLAFPDVVNHIDSTFMPASSYETVETAYEAGYISGIAPQVGVAAYFCVMFIAFNVCFLFFDNKRRLWQYLFIAVSVLALMLTQKRASFLGVFIVIAVFIVLKDGVRSFKKLLAAGMGLALVLLASTLIPGTQAIIERITTGSLSHREEIYSILVNQFKKNPITGVGLGNAGMYILGHYSGPASTAHNEYLRALCETGLPGFIAFVLALSYNYIHTVVRFRRALRKGTGIPESELILLGFSVFMQTFILMLAMTENPLSDYSQLYIYFLCVMLGNRGQAEFGGTSLVPLKIVWGKAMGRIKKWQF